MYIILAATVSTPSLASHIHKWNENKSAHHGCSILLWLGLWWVMSETLKLAKAGRALWGGFKDKALRRPLSPFGQRGLTLLHNPETLWVLVPAVSRHKNPPKACCFFTLWPDWMTDETWVYSLLRECFKMKACKWNVVHLWSCGSRQCTGLCTGAPVNPYSQ